MTAAETTTGLQIQLLDPRTLTAHPRNVRGDLGDLTGLTASIRAQGVLEPLIVVPICDGQMHQLVAGHRRAAAAIEAELERVPCIVRHDLAGLDDAALAEHVGAMLSENLHREGLTAMEEARGVKQMLDLGIPLSRVAKSTGLGQKRVKKAIGVARLDDATAAAVDAQQLDLDAAAAIALYADDQETTARLVDAAKRGPGQLAHALEREKQTRRAREKFEARVAQLQAAGRVVVDESSHSGTKNRRITTLNTSDGEWLADHEEEHRSCPGSAVHVALQWDDVVVTEVCTDIAANGHVDRWASSSSTSSKPETEEEKAAAKAERRKVIENNKAMSAANAVRRAWVKELLARRSAPPEVLRFAVEEMGARTSIWSWWFSGNSAPGDKDAAEHLGLEPPVRPWSMAASTHAEKPTTITNGEHVPDGRLPLQLLAHLAGAIELGIGKDSWRTGDHRRGELVRWLKFVAGLGYTLADIEQQIVDGTAR